MRRPQLRQQPAGLLRNAEKKNELRARAVGAWPDDAVPLCLGAQG